MTTHKPKVRRRTAVLAALMMMSALALPGAAAGDEPTAPTLVDAALTVPVGELHVPGLGDQIPGTYRLCLNGICVEDDIAGIDQDGLKQVVVRIWKEAGTTFDAIAVPAASAVDPGQCAAPAEGQELVGGVIVAISGTTSAGFYQAELGEWNNPETPDLDEFEAGEKRGVRVAEAEKTRTADIAYCLYQQKVVDVDL